MLSGSSVNNWVSVQCNICIAWPWWWLSGWGTAGALSWARWSPGPAWWTSRSHSPTCRSGSPTAGGCLCSRTACRRYMARSASFPWQQLQQQRWRQLLGQTHQSSAALGSRSMACPVKWSEMLADTVMVIFINSFSFCREGKLYLLLNLCSTCKSQGRSFCVSLAF